jgi:dTDP-4-amino-4,6-dideoxygalactose transaminase
MFSHELGRLFEHSLDPMNHGVPDYEVSRRGTRGLLEGKFRSYQEDLAAQQERWRALFDAVSEGPADLVVPQEIEKHVLSDSWMFAVRCPSSSARDGLAKSLLRRGIDSIKMYEQVPLIAKTRYGYVGGAPIADELCQTVLGLPVSSTGPVDDSSLASLLSQAVRTLR